MELISRQRARAGSDRSSATRSQHNLGVTLAGVTAVISGVSVFVNGYGVRHFDDATTYTTAKNLIAALVIAAAYLRWRRRAPDRNRPDTAPVERIPRRHRTIALVAVAVIGGSVPFVLFFEGLHRASSTDTAFIHKTLVIWVAVLAVVFLGERLGARHILALGLLLWGQAALTDGVGFPDMGTAEALILAATLCWAVEVVISRRVLVAGIGELELSTARMAGGVSLLLVWAVARGAFADLFTLGIGQWGWALLTGALLSCYVVSWHFALARAEAVDVTAVLVVGAVITAVLNAGVRDLPLRPLGLALLCLGGVLITVGALRPEPQLAAS